jgi:hypothetical protein
MPPWHAADIPHLFRSFYGMRDDPIFHIRFFGEWDKWMGGSSPQGRFKNGKFRGKKSDTPSVSHF